MSYEPTPVERVQNCAVARDPIDEAWSEYGGLLDLESLAQIPPLRERRGTPTADSAGHLARALLPTEKQQALHVAAEEPLDFEVGVLLDVLRQTLELAEHHPQGRRHILVFFVAQEKGNGN